MRGGKERINLKKDTCSPKLCTVYRRLPQFTISLPQYTISLPQFTVSLPQFPVSLPQYTISLSQFTVSLPRMRTCAARVPPVTTPPPTPLPLPLSGLQRQEVEKRGKPPSSKQSPVTALSSTSRRGPCTSSTCSAWGQLPTTPQLPPLTQPPPTCFLNKQHVLLCSPQGQASF
jgi:hypothetical protein